MRNMIDKKAETEMKTIIFLIIMTVVIMLIILLIVGIKTQGFGILSSINETLKGV